MLVMLWSGEVVQPSVAILCRGDFSGNMFSSFDNRKYLNQKQLLPNWLHLIDEIIVNDFEYLYLERRFLMAYCIK